MFPPWEQIEHLYEKQEFEAFQRVGATIKNLTPKEQLKYGRELLQGLWSDELVYLAKTTFIINKKSKLVLLEPNYAQLRFYKDVIVRCREEERPVRGIILKARQLGFSTFIQGLQFMWCDQNPYRTSMTMSYDEPSTEELFQKTQFVQEKLWFPRTLARSRAKTLHFDEPHGSMLHTRTAGNLNAGRGLTIQHLHCSEIPMWTEPEPTLVSVQQAQPDTLDTTNFYESTAKGRVGLFYDAWNDAEKGMSEFVPFFAPWFWDVNYAIPFRTNDHKNKFMRGLSPRDKDYQQRYGLSAEQMLWRDQTIRNKLKNSEAQFRQEYPACAEEAFLSSGRPVFNPDAIMALSHNATQPLWRGDIYLESAAEA